MFNITDKVRNSLSGSVGVVVGDFPDGFLDVDYGQGPKKTHPSRLTTLKSSTPKFLRAKALSPEYAIFLNYLRTPAANCRLGIEARTFHESYAIRDQYRKITGAELVEGEGYNIAPLSAKKQGSEGYVSFNVPEEMPLALKDMMVQRPGLINRLDVVWMLVENGFRVTRGSNV